jgi:hypothetical protein
MRETLLTFRLVLTSVLLFVFGYAVYSALDFTARARYFPLAIASFGVVTGVVAVVSTLVAPDKAIESGRKVQDIGALDYDTGPQPTAEFHYLLWILAYVVAVWVAGVVIASNLFVITFLRRVARWPLWRTILAAALLTGALYGVTIVLNLWWPVGLLGF